MKEPDNTLRYERPGNCETIRRAYLAAQGRWTGCDWDTDFGPSHLNLRGRFARQAQILANALAGAESQVWRDAQRWLEAVERDACDAEAAAARAVALAVSGDFAAADEAAYRACEIERKYPHPPVWHALLESIRQARAH